MNYNILHKGRKMSGLKNLTYVLDIGSSKISLLACCFQRGKSAIVSCVSKAYDGFMDGEFFSVEQLKDVIQELLSTMKCRVNKKIDNIHIGVPSEFCACLVKRVTRSFVPSKRLDTNEIAKMFDGIDGFGQNEDYIVVNFSPLKYVLDGNEVIELSNKRVSQFIMDCSYILVKKQFVDMIKSIFDECGIKKVDFVSTALAQAGFVSKQLEDKLKPVVVVDVGHITTSVAVTQGEGLLMLSSFSLGGGHITADLMQVNNLKYLEADNIKRKVSLTIQSKRDEKYVIYNNSQPIKALISITNDIVNARIESIASVIDKVLQANAQFKDVPIYLTGDGVCNFRGIVNLFEAVTNRKVYLLKSPLHNGEDKYQTSKISLANIIGDLV